MNKQIKKYVVGIAATAACILPWMQSCNVLDIDPTNSYKGSMPYESVKNLDLYVKDFYRVLYSNADISFGLGGGMDDGASELIKFSWYGVVGGEFNKYFYDSNTITPEGNFRSNWASMYTFIRQMNEYFYSLSVGQADGLDAEQVKIRTAEVRFLRAFAYQELVLRHGGVILRVSEDYVDGMEDRAKARSTEAQCWDFILGEYDKAFADLPKTWTAAPQTMKARYSTCIDREETPPPFPCGFLG